MESQSLIVADRSHGLSVPSRCTSLSLQQALELFRSMTLIRRCELQLAKSAQQGLVHGACHTYVGEEGVAVGVCSQLSERDMVFSTHRGHGHALAKGVSPEQLIAELYGRATGCSGGRGGSMHLFAPEVGLMGTSGIVGPCILQAAGAGYSFQLAESPQVAVAFFGDGAANNGAFHEGLNMAGVWKLPVLFVCENNQFATEVPFVDATANPHVANRGAAYGIPGIELDGNDVVAVASAAAEATERARAGRGPTLLECKTYRTRSHAEGMVDFTYRTREEVEAWKERCPIDALRRRLLAGEFGPVDVAALERIDEQVARQVAAAHEAAKGADYPPGDSATRFVFAEARDPVPASGDGPPRAAGDAAAGDVRVGNGGAGDAAPSHVNIPPAANIPRARPHVAVAKNGSTSDAPLLQSESRELSFGEATLEALAFAMRERPEIFVLGEGIGKRGGNFRTTLGLYEIYGPRRLRDTPICERGFVGLAGGAAMAGARPVVDFMFADFILDAVGEIVNQIAKIQYMSSGRIKMPIVLRGCIGIGHAAATHHSGSYYPMYAQFPGLRVVVPSTPEDAKGLFAQALASDDPVLFLEHRELMTVKGLVPAGNYEIPFGQARILREGTDLTVVALANMMHRSLVAADRAAQQGISVELIDPRTVAPLDGETIAASVAKTGRLLIVDEAFAPFGLGAEVTALVHEAVFDELDAPIRRLHGAPTPTPYSPSLEQVVTPQVEDIARAMAAAAND